MNSDILAGVRPAKARRYVPAVDADDASVLSGVLGYSKDRMAALYEPRIRCDDGGRTHG